jgi:anhydro-N-acetylmuramic acid kinase
VDTNKKNTDIYKVVGLMSGTSLDGVDIAYCTFRKKEGKWIYKLEATETISYPQEWKSRLSNLENQNALEFVKTDTEYGHYLGKITKTFLEDHNLKPDFIASHGHTIFHQPAKNFTFQIGKGSAIAAETGVPVICDFRSTDVGFGGQGAPLVPIGDRLLFDKYDYCLNLGGFANISYEQLGNRIAFDICPVNIVLNYLASFLQKEYDENGEIARTGVVDISLLAALNKLEFYKCPPPKSLGKEWVLSQVRPILQQFNISIEDLLRTFSEHIAVQVANIIRAKRQSSILVTGGGAFNLFLVERIGENSKQTLILPDSLTINYKEALIFAFLGVLRWRAEINCLKSTTGARKDNIGGAIYLAVSEP